MIKLVQLFIFMVLGGLPVMSIAQQTPLFGFNSQLLNVSNPSMTRSTAPLNVTLAGRKYWTGIQGSPEAFIGSFSLSPSQYKSAFGGFIWAEKAPLISKTVVGLNYAYSLKNMDEGNNLRLGAGIDFISVNANTSSILTEDYDDPFYTALLNNTRSSVDFRVGGTWNNELLEIGFAMQQIIQSKNTLGESVDGELIFNNPIITNGHIKYLIQPAEDIKITPLLLWQMQKSIPLRVDINILAEKTGKLWGGVWLRPKAAMGLMAGIWVLPDVKLGYMYEKTFFRTLSKAGNSHELILTYTPNLASKEKKPDTDKYEETKKAPEKPEPEIIRIRDTIVIVKETRVIETAKPNPTPTYTPKEEPKEVVTPTIPTAPAASGSKFYIVTGLFSLEANAKNYAKKLQAEGYKTSLVKNPTANQYYVSIGNFKTLEEAHQYMVAHPDSKYTFWVKEISN